MQKRISQNQWDEWKESEVTQWFFDFLQREANGLRQLAGLGAFRTDNILDTGKAYTEALIRAEVYERVSLAELSDTIEEDEYDSESEASGV